jgi:hypothetical protein
LLNPDNKSRNCKLNSNWLNMTNRTSILVLIALLTCVMFSCKKMDADLPPDIGDPAQLNVINTTADTLNIFQNGTRFNATSSFYPGGSLGYLEILAGEQQYQLKKAGTPNVLVSLPLQLDSGKVYSLFIAGNTADRLFLTNDIFLSNNDVQIRFVNASPDLSFDIKIAGNFSFTNRNFKSATDFVKMTAGKNHYELYQPGNSTPFRQGDLNLSAGRVYTLYTKGTLAGIGDNAFGVKIIANR